MQIYEYRTKKAEKSVLFSNTGKRLVGFKRGFLYTILLATFYGTFRSAGKIWKKGNQSEVRFPLKNRSKRAENRPD